MQLKKALFFVALSLPFLAFAEPPLDSSLLHLDGLRIYSERKAEVDSTRWNFENKVGNSEIKYRSVRRSNMGNTFDYDVLVKKDSLGNISSLYHTAFNRLSFGSGFEALDIQNKSLTYCRNLQVKSSYVNCYTVNSALCERMTKNFMMAVDKIKRCTEEAEKFLLNESALKDLERAHQNHLQQSKQFLYADGKPYFEVDKSSPKNQVLSLFKNPLPGNLEESYSLCIQLNKTLSATKASATEPVLKKTELQKSPAQK